MARTKTNPDLYKFKSLNDHGLWRGVVPGLQTRQTILR